MSTNKRKCRTVQLPAGVLTHAVIDALLTCTHASLIRSRHHLETYKHTRMCPITVRHAHIATLLGQAVPNQLL